MIVYENKFMTEQIKTISVKTAQAFLLPKHYSGRTPSISVAFGWYIDNELVAVCTFGKPASNSLCKGICGEQHSNAVYELNRLCRIDNLKEPLSKFVSACLRMLKDNDWIIVSYSDTDMNHHGYIYQACNFMYTGVTKSRTDIYSGNGKHSRHYDKNNVPEYRVVRSSKHRYVYFCTHSKKLKKQWKRDLKYTILDYPKGDNSNYILGEYKKDAIIDKNGNVVDDVVDNVDSDIYFDDLW